MDSLTYFTPVESGIGGLMIGLSAGMAYLVDGKITGISGIMGPFLRGVSKCEPMREGQLWKLLFLLGLVLGGLIVLAFNWDFSFPEAPRLHVVRYCLAGALVGFGTRVGKGCTSGHGICGLPRLSLRSWIAVPVFMAVAAGTVALTRHGLKLDGAGYEPRVAQVQWPPHWEFPAACLGASLSLLGLVLLLPAKPRSYVSPLCCGLIFALGLGASGMTSQRKVLNFLDFAGYWDPSLAFVMGCGLCVSFPAYFLAERRTAPPLCGGTFEKPPRTGNYLPLLLGSSCFGLGWGLVGLCPGPALAGLLPYLVSGIENGWQPDFEVVLAGLMICLTWLATDRAITLLTQPAQPAPGAAPPATWAVKVEAPPQPAPAPEA